MKMLQQGFSLIELLVVIAIIGILAAVGTTGYQSYIDGSKSKVAQANLETLVTALTNEDMAVSAGVTSPNAANCADGVSDCIAAIVGNSTVKNPYTSAAYGTDITVVATTALTCTAATEGFIEFVVVTTAVTSKVCTGGTDSVVGSSASLTAMSGA